MKFVILCSLHCSYLYDRDDRKIMYLVVQKIVLTIYMHEQNKNKNCRR